MVEFRERPRCRRAIERILKERACSLKDLLVRDDHFGIGDGMKSQVRKMIQEEELAQGETVKIKKKR